MTQQQGQLTNEQLFQIRRELLMTSLQRQFEYGKWVLASMLAAHLGALYVISQSGESALPLFRSSGSYLVVGAAMALVSGGLAWVNFSVASVAYAQALDALSKGETYAPTKKLRAAIWTTHMGAPVIALASLALFFLAARRALETI